MNAPHPEASGNKAAENVAEARQLLQTLQEQVGKHPMLEEAIEKLELALSALTTADWGLALAGRGAPSLPSNWLGGVAYQTEALGGLELA